MNDGTLVAIRPSEREPDSFSSLLDRSAITISSLVAPPRRLRQASGR